jgi:uncharacterized membrane protein YvlD (DUF360 family)
MLEYPLIIGVICGIINILLFMINTKLVSKEWDRNDIIKAFIQGFILSAGAVYMYILYTGMEPKPLLGGDQEIMLGAPEV